jgi:bifunctional non-homologous end joining protein LigD
MAKLRQPLQGHLRESLVRKRRPKADETPAPKALPVAKNGVGRSPAKPRAKKSEKSAPDGRVWDAKEAFAQKTMRGAVRVELDGRILNFTNVDKKYWPKEGYTKWDLLRYYYQMAGYIIPYLKDRPLILKRYPNGITGPPFYQHNLEESPDFMETFAIPSSDGSMVNYAQVDEVSDLLYLVNLGTIAQNPFHTKKFDLEHPDYFVFDLDPGDAASYSDVCILAMTVKQIMDKVGLKCYAKTSGSSGIHVYIPVKLKYTYDEIVEFSKAVATKVAEMHPKIATVERFTKNRKKTQSYVDYLQNLNGKSIASVYSVREKPGATVSTPLEWAEVKRCAPLSKFTIETVPARVKKKGDIFKDVLTKKQTLEAPWKKLRKLLEDD